MHEALSRLKFVYGLCCCWAEEIGDIGGGQLDEPCFAVYHSTPIPPPWIIGHSTSRRRKSRSHRRPRVDPTLNYPVNLDLQKQPNYKTNVVYTVPLHGDLKWRGVHSNGQPVVMDLIHTGSTPNDRYIKPENLYLYTRIWYPQNNLSWKRIRVSQESSWRRKEPYGDKRNNLSSICEFLPRQWKIISTIRRNETWNRKLTKFKLYFSKRRLEI